MLRRINDLIKLFLNLFQGKKAPDTGLDFPQLPQKSGDELKTLTCLRAGATTP